MTRPLIAGAALALGVALGGSDADAQSLLSRDWLVLQPEVGVSYANVVAVNQDGLFPSASSTGGWGPHFALQAGMRFGPVSFGGRFDYSTYQPYNLGGAGVFVELRLPIPLIQPFARLGAGFAWLGDLNPDPRYLACGATGSSSATCPSVSGWYGSIGGGIDLVLVSSFTLGAHVDVNLLNLNRDADPTNVTFMRTGDSVGLQATVGIHAALRI